MTRGVGPGRPSASDLLGLFPEVALVLDLAEGPPLLRLATAESCTGGLLGAVLTSRPGSSAVYVGGVVAYSNRLKKDLLGVPGAVLADRGAVSQEVAEAMADGARLRLGADVGVGITGVAGPGGSESKPAGLIFVSVADQHGVVTERLVEDRGRDANRAAAVSAALRLLQRKLAH